MQKTTHLRLVSLIVLVYLFLVAIKLMGDAFHLLGHDFAVSLIGWTSNPFLGLLIGIVATAIIQSSSVTTSVVVGLVSAGGLTVGNAIPIVMGANIGTTITNVLVSLGYLRNNVEFRRAFAAATIHDIFNVLCVLVFLPLELAFGCFETLATSLASLLYGSAGMSYQGPIQFLVKPLTKGLEGVVRSFLGCTDRSAGLVLLGLAFLLIIMALGAMVKLSRSMMVERIEQFFDRILSFNASVTILIGVLVTALVQSSSITTSLLVPMAGAGILTLEHVFPITLGANLGTTVTALLAALAGNVHGLAIALVHFLFNLSGIVIIYPLPAVRRLPLYLAKRVAEFSTEHKKWAIIMILAFYFGLPLALLGVYELFAG
ncbi:MAG: hypothetical protein A2284_13915 [Deltaproteobacteria bacterium RIFOXYA12_FULL_61_11]|nr:MAG: hypothetical protein A2284_13915 [Deltaproteobacteria bacterium RIFOXYA12_FULL_61_11]